MQTLRKKLESGVQLPLPNGLLINGKSSTTLVLKKGNIQRVALVNLRDIVKVLNFMFL